MLQFREPFLVETNKLLDEFSAILLDNENSKSFSARDIAEVFRIMHTLKGSVGMMGLGGLSALTHSLEDLFVLLKNDESLSPARAANLFDLLFEVLDALRGALVDFAAGRAEERSFDALIAGLTAFREGGREPDAVHHPER